MHQARLANLGAVVSAIERATPVLLQHTMPSNIVHRNIVFQVFPETHSLQVHGSTAYTTLQKMIQLTVCHLLVPSNSVLDLVSMRITKSNVIEDSRLHIQWRTRDPSPYTNPVPPKVGEGWQIGTPFAPGQLISSLGLLPKEYPVLAGSFEFGFDSQCEKIVLHILRDVEYMRKPDSQLILT